MPGFFDIIFGQPEPEPEVPKPKKVKKVKKAKKSEEDPNAVESLRAEVMESTNCDLPSTSFPKG